MDIVFNCPNCQQELAVDATAAGEEIQCPACNEVQIIPAAGPPKPEPKGEVKPETPAPPAAAPAHKERQLAVPQHQGPSEVLVKKTAVVAITTNPKDQQLRTKCIRRNTCVEVGVDKFDAKVAEFIHTVGDANVVSLHPLSYGYMDTTGHMLPDYGVMIVYRG